MHIAYLLTGGNEGNRQAYLLCAKEKVKKECGIILAASAVYETESWGLEQQSPFYNQALKIKTSLKPLELLEKVLSIERSLGRARSFRYAPRTIDIDIIFFDDLVIKQPHLTIPHPQLHNRRFALQCLNEIAFEHLHPLFGLSIHQLLRECTDPLTVRKID